MRIVNVHERILNAPADRVGRLVDSLALANDRLWPCDRWPAMQFDRPLGVGASGGHGPIGYVVESYTPGRGVQFRFTRPERFVGTHRFEIEPLDATKTKLRHVIEMQTRGSATLLWAIAIRFLHDALLEDLLDRAEAATGEQPPSRTWSRWVRFLRWAMRRRGASKGTGDEKK
jgi:hypothetical protein